MSITLTLTKQAVHGEADKSVSQAIRDEQNERAYPTALREADPNDPQREVRPLPDDLKTPDCHVIGLYTDDNGNRLEITVRNWDDVPTLTDTITVVVG